MDSLRTLLVAALAATTVPSAYAFPASGTPVGARGGKFSVTQVRNKDFQRHDGLQAMLRAYAKYNATLSPELRVAAKMNAANKKRDGEDGYMAGSVAAFPPREYDYEFVTPVGIGTPPQELHLVVDTGSADFWVLSTDTPQMGLANQTLYYPGNSSSSKAQEGSTWAITYGDGSGASGTTYSDTVTLGSSIRAFNQTIQSARRVSRGLATDPAVSGLLGLGMSAGNTVRPSRSRTLMDTLRGSLKKPLFAADLRSKSEGRYDFGFIDESAYEGTMQWVPVDNSSIYWKFTPSGYSVGSGDDAEWVAKPWPVIADTGTSLLLLPDQMVDAYYANIEGASSNQLLGGTIVPCDSKMPDFVFGIGYYRGVVPGRYMIYHNVNASHCFGGIQKAGGIGFSIFGDVLLKAQYVVFDLGHMKLGFANKELHK